MKADAINVKEKFFCFIKNYPLRLVFVKFMCFIAGIITSRGNILGGCYPFGVSFSASVPDKFAVSTIIGTLAGYLFPLNLNLGIRYISALISVAAVRWTLSDFTKIKEHFLYVPMLVFCSSLVTGLAVDSADGFSLRSIMLSVFESLVAAGAAYFFEKTFKILSNKKIKYLSITEFVTTVLSFNIILFSVSSFSPFGISLGRILAVLIILISSSVFGATGGCISGVASGVISGFSSIGLGNVSMFYAFGGMMSGIFSDFGKMAVSFSLIFSELLISFSVGDSQRAICAIYESVIASIIYLMIPKELFCDFKESNFRLSRSENMQNLKYVITQKLHFASKSVNAVPAYIEKAFWDVFKPGNKNLDFKTGSVNVVYSTCSRCKRAPYCWGEKAKSTSEFFENTINAVSLGQKINLSSGPFDFCENKSMIIKGMQENYNKFVKKDSTKATFHKFKKSIFEQMNAISSVMEDFVEHSNKKLITDEKISDALVNELSRMYIPVLGLVCYENDKKRMFIDIECDSVLANKFSEKVIKKMSETCGRNLSEPITNNYGATSRVQVCETKNLSVDFGFTQHAFGNGLVCGDSFCKFEDGEGNFNVILSDGMGTGDTAAIQGNITAELMKNFVKSGIGASSAVKFVNSTLLLNGGEETLSTLDMLSINLFDGNARFLKAGAPPTFIVRGGEIIKISAESLPIGILSEASVSCEEFNLQAGDFIIMFSDGVTDIGEDWICDIIKSKNYENAKELSKRIVKKGADIRKENNHDDDITCIAMKLAG